MKDNRGRKLKNTPKERKEKETYNKMDLEKANSEMVDLNWSISVIINVLTTLIKRQWLSDWQEIETQVCVDCMRDTLNIRVQKIEKLKGWEKINHNRKKSSVDIRQNQDALLEIKQDISH